MTRDLLPGDQAPDFQALAVGGEYGEGTEVRLADLAGRRVVLYFYPKDDTPGCIREACGLRDAWSEITATNSAVFGVSVDGAASHLAFIEKYHLPFPLLSDADHRMVKAYGVWVEKERDGKKSMGTERSTFVIGRDGRIEQVFRRVAPDEHAALLLPALR
ncbi:MAG: peroxiredoxin [Chthoniobacterales bacterium]|jgi:peroxiredoxin Q/BCP